MAVNWSKVQLPEPSVWRDRHGSRLAIYTATGAICTETAMGAGHSWTPAKSSATSDEDEEHGTSATSDEDEERDTSATSDEEDEEEEEEEANRQVVQVRQ